MKNYCKIINKEFRNIEKRMKALNDIITLLSFLRNLMYGMIKYYIFLIRAILNKNSNEMIIKIINKKRIHTTFTSSENII